VHHDSHHCGRLCSVTKLEAARLLDLALSAPGSQLFLINWQPLAPLP
jgi:hypothetical protein